MTTKPAESDLASTKSLIASYIKRELIGASDTPQIRDDTNLIKSGIVDSLSMLRLIAFVEAQFNVVVTPKEVTRRNFESVDSICEFLRAKQTTSTTSKQL
jgi:acyl carrier protein